MQLDRNGCARMAPTNPTRGPATLSLAPTNPLPRLRRLWASRPFQTGLELLRNADGPLTRTVLTSRWGTSHVALVSSPQGARDILGRNDEAAERGATPMACELRELIGDNLFVAPHRDWLPRRRALQPVFVKRHVARFAGNMAEVAEQLARRWADGAEVDLDSECRALTLRALGRSVLGVELDGRSEGEGASLRAIVEWVADRAARPTKPPGWLPTRGQRRAHAASAALHELAAGILQECRADPNRDGPLVRALMQAVDPQTGMPLTDRAICDELVLLLIAGHETTSTALSYALWSLGHHPELQERVAAEVSGAGQLTHEAAPRLAYTLQVLQEAMRLCPPVPVVERFLMQDVEADGHRLEAGTHVVIAINAIHRDPALWDDPLTFDPDRFGAARSKGRHSWQYLPFGGGQRSCIGQHFAMLEATFALAAIIGQFEIRSLDHDFPTIGTLTTIAAAPIRARVQRRNS